LAFEGTAFHARQRIGADSLERHSGWAFRVLWAHDSPHGNRRTGHHATRKAGRNNSDE
jgi:hypothetical protein